MNPEHPEHPEHNLPIRKPNCFSLYYICESPNIFLYPFYSCPILFPQYGFALPYRGLLFPSQLTDALQCSTLLLPSYSTTAGAMAARMTTDS